MADPLNVKVVVVILSWNKPQDVIACVERVKALSGAAIQIVVVDNASKDDSVAMIRRAHPDITVLEEAVNLGYAGGVNRGLAEAERRGANFAWLLNDDTSFDDGVLARLLEHAAARPGHGLLSPLLKDLDSAADADDQFRNGLIDWGAGVMHHNLPDQVYRKALSQHTTPIVPGTALLCDLAIYRQIGPFDERFFAYWEDTDYVVRAARAGFASEVVPSALVRHAATPTRSHRPPHYHYYMFRNEALFWRLHGRSDHRAWRRRWFASAVESIAQNRDLGQHGNVEAIVDGLWHAIRRRYGARTNHKPAPAFVRWMLGSRPYLLLALTNGDLRSVFRRLVGKS